MVINYADTVASIIATGIYNLDDITARIERLWIESKLTDAERDTLTVSANENAKDVQQVDLYAKIVELENRVFALEHPAEEEVVYPVWVSGYTTQKGEVVQYDYDKDGVMDLLRYDGGRSQTALSPGKIDGWHVVDAQGNVLGTWYNGEYTPITTEEEVTDDDQTTDDTVVDGE